MENRPASGMAPEGDPFAGLAWLEGAASPFPVRCLDCRSVALTMVSVTSDPAVAESFTSLREDSGERHRGALPTGAAPAPCALRYPFAGAFKEGAIFLSQEMEDKWDIRFFDGGLYFSRSWTGDLALRADLSVRDGEALVRLVHGPAGEGEPPLCVREVDFLIRTFVFGLTAPHPLPASAADRSMKDLALHSFARYGRRGLFGSFGDTTGLIFKV